MGKLGTAVRRGLYRHLSLENYLKVLSSLYLWGYRLKLSPRSSAYEYPFFLQHLVSSGDTAIDIGANLGYYSFVLARLTAPGGRVYAVEPVPPIHGVLRRNVGRFKHVTLMPYALGDKNTLISMGNDTVRENGYFGTGRNFVVEKPTEGLSLVEFEAHMRRGSELFAELDRIDFIKCDIEGYEKVVIPEMIPLIGKFHPTLLIETGGSTRSMIIRLIQSQGYRGFTLHEGGLLALDEKSQKDIIFIHQSKLPRYLKLIRS